MITLYYPAQNSRNGYVVNIEVNFLAEMICAYVPLYASHWIEEHINNCFLHLFKQQIWTNQIDRLHVNLYWSSLLL